MQSFLKISNLSKQIICQSCSAACSDRSADFCSDYSAAACSGCSAGFYSDYSAAVYFDCFPLKSHPTFKIIILKSGVIIHFEILNKEQALLYVFSKTSSVLISLISAIFSATYLIYEELFVSPLKGSGAI